MAKKVLGQSAPAATVLTDLYTVPATKETVGSTITVCNRATSTDKFRISVAVAGAGDATKQYIAFNTDISGENIVEVTVGITLATIDVVRCYSRDGNLSFNMFGD